MSGFEDAPERSGEICVAEVFGGGVTSGKADVGIGIHRFGDPSLDEEFGTVALPIDVSQYHDYGVRWRSESVTFLVDGQPIGRVEQSPSYPMQLMLGLFDFPSRAGSDDDRLPEMVISRVLATEPL